MAIDDLIRRIEEEFKDDMSPKVRRYWLNGYRYYYVVPNPPDTRRRIFMDMLSSAYDEKPPEELKKALKSLYQKLEAERGRP
jgi:hypothetical protein